MDPARLIPAAEAIPSPWGWLEVLLWLTFAVHLVFMNLAVGSTVIALAGRVGGRRELARELSRRTPAFLALTVNFGVAPLLFVQVLYGQFLYTSSVLMAWFWLSVIFAVIGGYYAAYVHDAKFESSPRRARLALWISLALLLYTGFLFANNMTLMLRPAGWTAYFSRPDGALLNLSDPTMWTRAGHILLAAPAVAGLYAALLGKKKHRSDWVDAGLTWFTRATMLQMLFGLGLLASLPRDVMFGFLGRSPLAMALLGCGVFCGLAALVAGLRKKSGAAAGLVVATIFLMAATRAQVRLLTLAPYFRPSSLPVAGDDGALAMFLISLALGLAVMGWMLRVYGRAVGRR